MGEHPSFEDLSAHHDGEAPEWAAHVAACGDCRRRLDDLAALSAVVAGPAPAPAAAGAGDPVAIAVAAATGGATPGRPEPEAEADRRAVVPTPDRPGPRPSPTRWLPAAAAVAAMVVVAIALAAFLGRSSSTGGRTSTAAGPTARPTVAAPESKPAPGGESAVVGGDLGDVPDVAALSARLAPIVRPTPGSEAAPDAGAAAPAPAPSGAAASVPPRPQVVGTRPCETEARQRSPGALGNVVYVATATHVATPAVVLAFAPAQGGGPITVEMMAQAGCGFLLETSIP
jgi:hypothetical protein